MRVRFGALVVVSGWAVPLSKSLGVVPSLVGIGSLEPFNAPRQSYISGLSGDGSTVLATSYTTQGRACVWTEPTGLVEYGPSSWTFFSLWASDFAGSAFFGKKSFGAPSGPACVMTAVWTVAPPPAGILAWTGGDLYAASDAGDVTVGFGRTQQHPWNTPLVWRVGQPAVLMSMPPNARNSEAWDVSGDGSVVVGTMSDGTTTHAFLYTDQLGVQLIPELPNQTLYSATSISQNGRWVVGAGGQVGVDASLYRWSDAVGTLFLPGLPGPTNARATGVSADGRIVVGWQGNGAEFATPFIWTSQHGSMDFRVYLTQVVGINLQGWNLHAIKGLSHDGMTIAGQGFNALGQNEAWVARIPKLCHSDIDNGSGTGTPGGGTDINDLLYFLLSFEAGTLAADVDDGGGNGYLDGSVDVRDILYYLNVFEAGC